MTTGAARTASPATLAELLQTIDAQAAPAAYARAAREIAALAPDLTPVRIALLASFTVAPLVPYLIVEAARRGFAADVHVGAFDNVVQELTAPDSTTATFGPDIVFAAQLLEDVFPQLADVSPATARADVSGRSTEIVESLLAGVRTWRDRSPSAVVLQGFARTEDDFWLCRDEAAQMRASAVVALNSSLTAAAARVPGVHVLEYGRLVGQTGSQYWRDDKLWYLARAPLSRAALRALATCYASYVAALQRPARKCLVVDLDGTLWGGVLGEAGLTGIQLGSEYPGNVFRDLQKTLLALKARGVLLAVNSKNNVDDVREVFDRHPAMILRLDDFAALRVNWQPKPDNIRDIARELNIGLDSLVFFDDNPAERELMRQAAPDVLTLELPAGPIGYAAALRSSGAFERLAVTAEDRQRTELYHAQRGRQSLRDTALSLEDFLASLNMRVSIEPVNDVSLPRVVDLLQKTNQFNVTTRRHTAAQVAAMIANPSCGVFTARVVDRFGDNGLVAVAIVRAEEPLAQIDSLLLSCRVIGRTIETALLAFIVQWARTRGLTAVEGEFVPTAKNAPAADVFARHGFREHDSKAGIRWRLHLSETEVVCPSYMNVLT